MAYKIKGTYKKTGRRVNVTTRKFKTKKEAKEYNKLVLGSGGKKRFKGIRYEKV